jgi:hypothetical protein
MDLVAGLAFALAFTSGLETFFGADAVLALAAGFLATVFFLAGFFFFLVFVIILSYAFHIFKDPPGYCGKTADSPVNTQAKKIRALRPGWLMQSGRHRHQNQYNTSLANFKAPHLRVRHNIASHSDNCSGKG